MQSLLNMCLFTIGPTIIDLILVYVIFPFPSLYGHMCYDCNMWVLVCVCVCVCMCVCVCVCLCVWCVGLSVYLSESCVVCLCERARVYIYECMHAWVIILTGVHQYLCMYECMHADVYPRMYACSGRSVRNYMKWDEISLDETRWD